MILAGDFAGLADALELPERDTPAQQRKIDAVRAWLERSDNWLAIFDNTPNPDSIRSFLPRTTTGHVLVTSRHQSRRELGVSVGAEELELEEAVEFLLQRTAETDRAAAARLAETHAVLAALAAERGGAEEERLHHDRTRELRPSNREGPLAPRWTQPPGG